MGFSEFAGRAKGLLGRRDASGTEPTRVLIGDPFDLDPKTRVQVQALCGSDLRYARLVPLGETTLGQHKRVTRIQQSDRELADGKERYLLEPGTEVIVNRSNSTQLATERAIAAYGLIQDDSVLRKVVAGADPTVISLGQILEVHVALV